MDKPLAIYYLDNPDEVVTGGHRYNAQFKQCLADYTGIPFCDQPQMYGHYKGWKYPFAPLFELNRLRMFKPGDMVFFSDTAYMYHLLLLMLTRLFKHTRNICIVHHFPWLGQTGFVAGVRRIWMKMYYRRMSEIIVPSPFTLDVAKSTFPSVKITYIPLPFEQRFAPSDNYENGRLLFVGTIEPRKGVHLLLEALTHVNKDYRLHLVGKTVDIPYLHQLKHYISAHGLTDKVVFEGAMDTEQLRQSYEQAEVFVFPSQLEGYGMVLVEAMQHGLPIVAFDNTAMPYSIHDGMNGYLAQNRNTVEMAEKIEKILGNLPERQKIQNGIRQHLRQLHTYDDFVAAIHSFWNTLIA